MGEVLVCLPQVLARLVLDHPGVRHRCVADAAEAADHISQLTKGLAVQPFKVQVSLAGTPSPALHDASTYPDQLQTGLQVFGLCPQDGIITLHTGERVPEETLAHA